MIRLFFVMTQITPNIISSSSSCDGGSSVWILNPFCGRLSHGGSYACGKIVCKMVWNRTRDSQACKRAWYRQSARKDRSRLCKSEHKPDCSMVYGNSYRSGNGSYNGNSCCDANACFDDISRNDLTNDNCPITFHRQKRYSQPKRGSKQQRTICFGWSGPWQILLSQRGFYCFWWSL